MAVRLTVHSPDSLPGPDAPLLFEQQRITIGRAPSNDVVLHDPKVSKQHAVIELAATGHHVVRDRESRNATFVDGDRIGPSSPTLLTPEVELRMGDTLIEYVPLVPATTESVSSSSEEKSDAEPPPPSQDVDPVDPIELDTYEADTVAALLVACLSRLHVLWSRQDEMGNGHFETIIAQTLTAAPDAAATLDWVNDLLADRGGSRSASEKTDSSNGAVETSSSSPDVSDTASMQAPHPTLALRWNALFSIIRDILYIPNDVWSHLDSSLEAAENPFFQDPDVSAVKHAFLAQYEHEHDTESFAQLCTALNHIVVHHRALLQGYVASIEPGGKALLRRISPRDSVRESGSGVFRRFFGGGDGDLGWERLERRWRKLYHSNWSHVERELFREAFLEAYRTHIEETPGADVVDTPSPLDLSNENEESGPSQSFEEAAIT